MLKELFKSKKYYSKNKNKPLFETRKTKKISLISPIQYKKDKIKDKILLKDKKSNFQKYKNLGLELIIPNSHKRNYIKNNIIYPYLNSKNSIKTTSSNIYLTTANTTSNNENKTMKFYSFDEGKILYKKKINLQNDIISLKNEKYNILKENKEYFECENKIKILNNEVDKMNKIINNYKKDYNELNSQCLNLKKRMESIQKKNEDSKNE